MGAGDGGSEAGGDDDGGGGGRDDATGCFFVQSSTTNRIIAGTDGDVIKGRPIAAEFVTDRRSIQPVGVYLIVALRHHLHVRMIRNERHL